MKIEFSLTGDPDWPCHASCEHRGIFVHSIAKTWAEAEAQLRAKLKLLAAVPPPPEPVTI